VTISVFESTRVTYDLQVRKVGNSISVIYMTSAALKTTWIYVRLKKICILW